MSALLKVEKLGVAFETRRGVAQVIDDLSFSLEKGRTLGIVGESGSGKSVTSLAIMGLLPNTARITSGRILYSGNDIVRATEAEMRQLRGARLSMIFQDPMTSLNPCYTVGVQIREAIRKENKDLDLDQFTLDLLRQVGIPDPELRLKAYPHQLSGGMSQRVMIAMAIASSPEVLIADEPTTALDVTVQAQILNLLKKIQEERKMGLILITHDIGVVAKMADDILVMYAGQAMEVGPKEEVIRRPRHPYTEALLASLPGTHDPSDFRTRLPTIEGMVPDLLHRPRGCQVAPRCSYRETKCEERNPEVETRGSSAVRCFKPLDKDAGPR